MSHILKTIYKGWNYIVTFSTPLFGGYVVYDIQQIVFNKERQEKYSESRQSKPTNIEPSTTFSNIKNPTFDEKSNIKNHRDESQGLEKKKQQISNIPTASEKENKPTQTQNKIPPSKQPLYKGKSIMTNSTDESQQRLEENTQQRNIIPSTTEREKEPTNKQEQKIPSQQRLPEENKIIKEPPEGNTIPTTTEKETKPTQKQVETLTSKQPMSKGNQIIQKPTEDNDISAAKHQKENARKPFFKCKPYSTYIDLRKFNSIQTVTVCTGCPSPLQLSLQIWRLLLKAMIGYCSQKTVDGLRYLYSTFLDSITTEQESTSTNDLPRSNTTIGIRVCDYLRQMTQMLRFRMYEDQLQLVFTPIVREVNDDLNRSIIEFGFRVCDYLRRHLVPFVVTYDRDQRQFVLTIRVEELKYLYQPAIQVGVNVENVPLMISLPNEIPLDKRPHGTLKKSSGFSEISMMDVDHEALRKRKPPGPPPGPPPQLSDSEDEEYDPEKGSKSRKIRFVDDDTRDPDEEEKDTRLKFEAPKESSESSSDSDSDTKDRRSRRSWGADERERDKEKRRRDDEDKKKPRDSLPDGPPGADEKQAQPKLVPSEPPPGAPSGAPPGLTLGLPPD